MNRGFVFSLIALLLLIPLALLVIWNASASSSSSEQLVVRMKGGELANFAASISQDSQRALEISAKSALVALIGHVIAEGNPADDSQARILELMFNGTYGGLPSSIMQNNSLSGWALRVQSKSWAYGLNASVTINSVSVDQLDSFTLLFSMNLSVKVRAQDDSMNFSRNYDLKKKVSVEGLEDVSFPLNSYGLIKRQYAANSTRVYGVTALQSAIQSKIYVSSSDAPGFLDKLEGAMAPSGKYPSPFGAVTGLETFIDPLEFYTQDLPIFLNVSAIDHFYFNETKLPGKAINQTAYPEFTYDYFALDDGKAEAYGVLDALVD
ncbi:MAG: hypothetical protein V1834_02190 [Candidatus Micrarchaeota archaeon]